MEEGAALGGEEMYDSVGFSFNPTDTELIDYLTEKVSGCSIPDGVIESYDVYTVEPWLLPRNTSTYIKEETELYFFTTRHPCSAAGSARRTNRSAGRGYWDGYGRDQRIMNDDSDVVVGHKTSLVFRLWEGKKAVKTDWIMDEFRLHYMNTDEFQNLVLCRIHKKRTSQEDPSGNVVASTEEQPLPKKRRIEEPQLSHVYSNGELNQYDLVGNYCINHISNPWENYIEDEADASSIPMPTLVEMTSAFAAGSTPDLIDVEVNKYQEAYAPLPEPELVPMLVPVPPHYNVEKGVNQHAVDNYCINHISNAWENYMEDEAYASSVLMPAAEGGLDQMTLASAAGSTPSLTVMDINEDQEAYPLSPLPVTVPPHDNIEEGVNQYEVDNYYINHINNAWENYMVDDGAYALPVLMPTAEGGGLIQITSASAASFHSRPHQCGH